MRFLPLLLSFIQNSMFNVGCSMFDVHPLLEQSFFQIICLFLHLFPFKIRCWTFDVRCSSFTRSASLPGHISFCSYFPVIHSSLPVHLFPVGRWKLKVGCWTFISSSSSLSVHLLPVRRWKLKVRCWTFISISSSPPRSTLEVESSMLDVHFYQFIFS